MFGMNTKLLLTALVLLIGNARAALEKKTLSVDGVSREYLIHVPVAAATTPAPLVFTFHGHGGTAGQAARSFSMHKAWPDAVCVYMQGLPTVGQLTDPEGRRPGWQKTEGDQGDRDLKFFDATLQAVQTACKIDPARI